MSPDVPSAEPKYLQVVNHLRARIVRGELKPGDELPSERQIVDEWGISRPTATRALAVLRSEGLAEARQGSGTFVRDRPRLNRRARDRYARARTSGRVYTPGERAEILSVDVVHPPAEIAELLELPRHGTAVRRRRLIREEAGPVELATSWLDGDLARRAPRLLAGERITEGTVAYVEKVTGRRAATARDLVGARSATAEERRLLELPGRHAAVLAVRHTVLDLGGLPMEFVEAVYPPDRWSFEQEYAIPT